MFDKFFDSLNVSNFTNGTWYNKDFQHLYHQEDKQLNASVIPFTSFQLHILVDQKWIIIMHTWSNGKTVLKPIMGSVRRKGALCF